MSNTQLFSIKPCGDSAVTIEFGETICPEINDRVLALDSSLRSSDIEGIVELVPTYRSLFVHYNPTVVKFSELVAQIRIAAENAHSQTLSLSRRKWRVPVVYGGQYGIDLDMIAGRAETTSTDVIRAHSAPLYRVYMVGFSAGFTYLGGLAPELACPRRNEPRLATPAGSVTLGGNQTAIQSLAGPTGWHLLGRTPVRSFHLGRDPMFLFEPGDFIQFFAIDARDWAELDSAAQMGEIVAELVQ